MRIWLKPDQLAQFNLTPSDVAAAISEQNAQFAAGKFGQAPQRDPPAFAYTVTTQGRLADPKEFENIIRAQRRIGGSLRLKDVARVELGAKNYASRRRSTASRRVPVGIFLQPGANALEVDEGGQGRR